MTDLFVDVGYGNLVHKAYCCHCDSYNYEGVWSDHDEEDHRVIILTPDTWYYDDYILHHTSSVGEIDFMGLNDFWYVEKHFYYECTYCQNSPEDCLHFAQYDENHNVPDHERCPQYFEVVYPH